MGVAKAVEPGELIGIDIEDSQIEMARRAARDGEHHNARFQAGDAASLPFEDNSFNAAHCHAVLMHVRDNMAVLDEIMRVLKPEGTIASREMIGTASLLEPETESLRSAWQTFTRPIEANGGHPDMGKQLKSVLQDSGFENVRATASFECYSDDDDVEFFRDLALGWFCAPDTVEAAKRAGLATQEQFDGWRRDLDAWASRPGAFAAIAWGKAVARKPTGPAPQAGGNSGTAAWLSGDASQPVFLLECRNGSRARRQEKGGEAT